MANTGSSRTHTHAQALLEELAKLFLLPKDQEEMRRFLLDFLTLGEREQLVERWQIIDGLLRGEPQRSVRDRLGVSISKVSRGSAVLASGTGAFELLWKRRHKKK